MKDENGTKRFMCMVAVVVIIIVGLVALAASHDQSVHSERSEHCESLNGVYLRSVTGAGKAQTTSYFCLKKDTVIEPKGMR